MQTGILVINKPAGITSHDVVDVIRRITNERRVGHAGTLDPFATGVLVVGVGREATRSLGLLSTGTRKTYKATIHLGAESDTGDPEGRIVERDDVVPPKKQEVHAALAKFHGTQKQIPPVFSSIKQGGVKAYERARRGEVFTMEARDVTIHSLSILRYAWPEVVISVTCSSGTYIRSLARDLGEALGTGGYLTALVRTAVGSYTLGQAHTLEEIAAHPTDYFLPIPTASFNA